MCALAWHVCSVCLRASIPLHGRALPLCLSYLHSPPPPSYAAGDEISIERGVYEDFFTVQPSRPDGSVTQDLYIHGEPGTVVQAPVR